MTGPKKACRTFTGREFNPLELSLNDICIEDIAHSLAQTNRFTGHVRQPINVAQHSVNVARLCNPPFVLQGLLHDGSEAYLGDVSKWLKASPEMKAYRVAEDRAQKLIFEKFGCPTEVAPTVEDADRIMVRYEGMRGFGPDFKIDHPDYPKLTADQIYRIGQWVPWDWQASEIIFMNLFRKLYPNK